MAYLDTAGAEILSGTGTAEDPFVLGEAAPIVTDDPELSSDPDTADDPDTAITREEMATTVCNFAARYGIALEDSGSYTDYSDQDAISDWAVEYVETVTRAGIMSGHADGSFGPRDATMRSHSTTVAVNFYEQYLLEE